MVISGREGTERERGGGESDWSVSKDPAEPGLSSLDGRVTRDLQDVMSDLPSPNNRNSTATTCAVNRQQNKASEKFHV